MVPVALGRSHEQTSISSGLPSGTASLAAVVCGETNPGHDLQVHLQRWCVRNPIPDRRPERKQPQTYPNVPHRLEEELTRYEVCLATSGVDGLPTSHRSASRPTRREGWTSKGAGRWRSAWALLAALFEER